MAILKNLPNAGLFSCDLSALSSILASYRRRGIFFARAERELVPDLPSVAGSRRNLTWAQSCRRDMIGRRGTVGVSGGDDFWGDGGMFSSIWLSVF